MKKPHRMYWHICRADLNERKHRAWLYDTILEPFDRKRLRFKSKFASIIFWVSLPLFVCWKLVEPHWKRFDLFVDNFVGGLRRIPQGFLGLFSILLIQAILVGMVNVHSLSWSFLAKFSTYICGILMIVLLAEIGYYCMERCACNFCADAKKWQD